MLETPGRIRELQRKLYRKAKVIDADISKYFDAIVHDKLLALVARRIVDKHILQLIKLWLSVISPGDYEGELRLIFVWGNSREKRPFLSPRISLPQLEAL